MSITKLAAPLAIALAISFTLPIINHQYQTAYASETGNSQETELKHKIDTSKLSGVDYWIADMYNNDRVMYAVVVTLVMAVLGTSMAFLTDLVLKALGLEVSKISHRE